MFFFERKSKTPLYQQLYEQLRQQITEGLFPKGGKLPPTRELAVEYHLSRNTVIQAYQQLEIEGYIRGTIGSGYYVEDISPFPYSYCRMQPEESLFPKVEKSEILYDFYYGNLDYNCYQSKAWRRCLLEPVTGQRHRKPLFTANRRVCPHCATNWQITCIFPVAFAVVQIRSY